MEFKKKLPRVLKDTARTNPAWRGRKIWMKNVFGCHNSLLKTSKLLKIPWHVWFHMEISQKMSKKIFAQIWIPNFKFLDSKMKFQKLSFQEVCGSRQTLFTGSTHCWWSGEAWKMEIRCQKVCASELKRSNGSFRLTIWMLWNWTLNETLWMLWNWTLNKTLGFQRQTTLSNSPMHFLKTKVVFLFFLLGGFSQVHEHVCLDGCRRFLLCLHKVVRFAHATWLAYRSFLLKMWLVLGLLMLLLYNSPGQVSVVKNVVKNEQT